MKGVRLRRTKPPKQKPPKRKDIRGRGRPHRKFGAAPRRPHKYSTVDVAGLVKAVAEGVPISIACRARNINPDTFQDWLNTREAFALALAKAKEAAITQALTAIRNGSKEREWRGDAFFLERVYRDFFAAPSPGVALGIQNNFTISYEKAKEIEAMRNQLLPEVQARLGLTNGNGEANGQ